LLDVNSKKGVFTFKKSEIRLNDLHLYASGWVIDRNDRQEMDLKITTSKATLKELVSTLPEKYSKRLGDYRYEGNSIVSVHLKGLYGSNRIPSVRVELSLEEGVIGRQHTNVSLENVNLVIVYFIDQNFLNERLNITDSGRKSKMVAYPQPFNEGYEVAPDHRGFEADVDLEDIRQRSI